QEPYVCSRLRMMEECYPPHFGRHLLENLQPFPAQLRFEIVEARNVSARMRQARNEAASDRIGDERKDNRNGLRLLQYRRHCWIRSRENHIRRGRAQSPSRDADTFSDSTREPVLNPNIAAV